MRLTLAIFGSLLLAGAAWARQVSIHDPVIAREGATYYLFSTGPGITFYSSTDRVHWRRRGRIFPGEPAWAKSVAPLFNGHVWAPDIIRHNGKFYLFYSVSSFGRNTSAIGVTINRTLDPDSPDYHWEDQGVVLRSVPNRDLWNAIDPAVFIADDGTPWMSFGSFWGGLKLVKLAPSLTAPAEPQEWHALAKRERSVLEPDSEPGPAEIEAPFIFKKGKYYYLFVSWDKCCLGKDSTYKMAVGRAEKITGPYLDRTGRDLATGGGTLLLAGTADWAGVGHNSAYTFDGRDYLVFHAYETADHGLQKLKIAELTWDAELWPVVDPRVLNQYTQRPPGLTSTSHGTHSSRLEQTFRAGKSRLRRRRRRGERRLVLDGFDPDVFLHGRLRPARRTSRPADFPAPPDRRFCRRRDGHADRRPQHPLRTLPSLPALRRRAVRHGHHDRVHDARLCLRRGNSPGLTSRTRSSCWCSRR